jgi:hypothetical protein
MFGSGRAKAGTPDFDQAEAMGRAIAQAGWALCNGGYGGTMEAGAKGAFEAGGHTIGVSYGVLGRGRGVNRYIREEVSTEDHQARLQALLDRGDGYVILPGGTGTLVELATCWELKNKRLASNRPIVLLGDYWRAVVDTAGRDDPSAVERVSIAGSVEEAVATLSAAFDA